jgi:hypothetical protein
VSSDLLSSLLPLAGVALGSAGTFLGQYLASRETKKQARAAADARLRAERKEAILSFLDACQNVEAAAEDLYLEHDRDELAIPALTHKMWLQQKYLDIICGPTLRNRAYLLTDRLHSVAYTRPDTPVWELVNERRSPFLEAARAELVEPGTSKEIAQ